MSGLGEVNMVLALSLLLTAGFALARLAKALAATVAVIRE